MHDVLGLILQWTIYFISSYTLYNFRIWHFIYDMRVWVVGVVISTMCFLSIPTSTHEIYKKIDIEEEEECDLSSNHNLIIN